MSAGLDDSTDHAAHPDRATRANRAWWDAEAAAYQREHGPFLAGLRGAGPAEVRTPDRTADLTDDPARPGSTRPVGTTTGPRPAPTPADLPARLVWCPEGLDEEDARLLGPPGVIAGRRVLEVGAGAAQGSRWVAEQGGLPVALDLSGEMLAMRARPGEQGVPAVVADAGRVPLADDSVDLAFSAFGALPFVADAGAVLAEVARVVRPGGRWVCSTSHPFRWTLPDDPGWDGLKVGMSYFDRRPYVERDEDGRLQYAEFHRTVGDWVRLVRAAGMVLEDAVEPEWPDGLEDVWGGWSPLRGEYVPGTLVLSCTVS